LGNRRSRVGIFGQRPQTRNGDELEHSLRGRPGKKKERERKAGAQNLGKRTEDRFIKKSDR